MIPPNARNGLICRVEQAIAFGRSLAWMAEHLGVDAGFVAEVRERMDEAIADDDEPEPVDETPYERHICGSHAAFNRHKKRGEPVDEFCRAGERKYQRLRHQRRIAGRRAA